MSDDLLLNQIDPELLSETLQLALRLGLFLASVAIAPQIGRSLPLLLWQVLKWNQNYTEINARDVYKRYVKPVQNLIAVMGGLIFVALNLNWLIIYEELYGFLGFFVYSALSIGLLWFASQATRQIIRQSVIHLVKRWFGEVNEIVLVFETLIYIVIVLVAIVIFARGLQLDLFTLSASLGIGGVAVAFASQQALGRLVGTLELYLDRPYLPGEYIRVTFNPYAEEVYGRIESIGLRSTKIRIVARNTVTIVPNSMMASLNIENISRGKKIMAILCLNFNKLLKEGECALVRQIIDRETIVFRDLDRASTQVQFESSENNGHTRARAIFFLTGSSRNSVELRKGLLELANEAIAQKLAAYNITFTTPDPIVYIDSPMSI
ncbi:mechanosensitive ion channel family protein [Roseofilum casamattae]|uniref:Mechanosensitive ion channel n=1 Tax=Roseofilum casamattae BLCC-M143 TaxID=3022442 RepID=A0ABT7BRB2_9CYAN|nr:mechanosensitive ion channel domain-containing protein [Roseofilum casamattae]MDJ1181734.1 mechanosensitive ion channel [Roseofilum casamattae BLCC-M143]